MLSLAHNYNIHKYIQNFITCNVFHTFVRYVPSTHKSQLTETSIAIITFLPFFFFFSFLDRILYNGGIPDISQQ